METYESTNIKITIFGGLLKIKEVKYNTELIDLKHLEELRDLLNDILEKKYDNNL